MNSRNDHEDTGLVIRNVRKKIGDGERRAEHLERQIQAGDGPGGLSPAAQVFACNELAFIRAGLTALRYYESNLSPETSVPQILRELLDELKRLDIPGQTKEHDHIARITTKARRALDELR